MLSNIVPSKLVGCIKLDVAGNTYVMLDPPVLVKLNQFREIQWWGTYIANIVMLRISGMLQPNEKGFKIDFASLAVGILQKHDQNLSGVCLEV